jgi:DNA helicase HerA-like ATPase
MLLVMGDVLDTETSFPIHELLNENVVIELDGLRRDEANFLVEHFLAYIFCYRLANGERGEISHLNVFDEASRYFFKGRQFRETSTELGISFLDTVPQIIRDYKEGLLAAAQEPSLISHSLMSNLRTKIVGYLSEGQDIDAICDSLNLDDEDRQELGKLGERGYWIVKRAGEEPLVVRTDDFPIAKDMTDEELQERMDGFVQHLIELSKQAAPVVRHEKIVEEPKIVAPGLSADAWNVLVNVCEHPFFGIRSRCESLRCDLLTNGTCDRGKTARAEYQQNHPQHVN